MEKFLLSLFLLTAYVHGSTAPDDIPKANPGRRALMLIKVAASDVYLSKMLDTTERGLSFMLPASFRYNNILAQVGFEARVLGPKLYQNAGIASAKLAIKDIEELRNHLLCIQDRVRSIASDQGFHASEPLLVRIGNRVTYRADMLLGVVALKVVGAFGARDTAHDLREQTLINTLQNLNQIGIDASLIKVSMFKSDDYYRMEEVANSLKVLKSIFKKADVC